MAIPFSMLGLDKSEVKPGVDLADFDVRRMRPVVESVRRAYSNIAGAPIVVTSGRDGVHSANSFHYRGQALDFRTRHIPLDKRLAIVDEVRKDLGIDYDVVLEDTHLHVEYDKA